MKGLDETVSLVRTLYLISLTIQTVEILRLRSAWSEGGVWRWSTLAEAFRSWPKPLRRLLDLCFTTRGFSGIMILRLGLIAGASWAPQPWLWAALGISSLLVSVRWRGAFNGGSDAMTILVGVGVFLTALEGPAWSRAGLAFIAFHVCSSFFFSGLAKAKNPDWWNGRALTGILKTSIYGVAPFAHYLIGHRRVIALVSALVIVFELIFPLAALSPQFASFLIPAAVLFHLINIQTFGLNRFLWAWAPTYPAVLYIGA